MILNVNLETINRLLGIKNSKVVGNLIIETDIITESENEVVIDVSARIMQLKDGTTYKGIPTQLKYYRGYYVYCKNCLRKISEVTTVNYIKILEFLYDHECTKCPSCDSIFIKN